MSTPKEQSPKDRARLRQAVLQARNEGKPCAHIARELGITEGALAFILRPLLRCGAIEKRSTPTGPSLTRLDRLEKVRQLANQGYSPAKIAAEMGLSHSTILRDLAALRDLGLIAGPVRQPRQVAKLTARRERVRQLREAGWTLKQIAEQLGVSLATVNRDLAALRITPAADQLGQSGDPRVEERADLRLSVLRLWQEGKQGAEIAAALGVSIEEVRAESSVLIELGWLPPWRCGAPSKIEMLQPGNPRYDTMVRMLQEGASLEQIGDVLGVTGERVRQLRDQIEAVHGPVAELLGGWEAARYLGIDEQKFRELVHKGVIRGVGSSSFPQYRCQDLQSLRHRRDRYGYPPPLVGGPYQCPPCRIGSVLTCEYRDCDVKVDGLSDAPIIWPHGRRGGGSPPSLIVCHDLVRAIRTEPETALQYYWGVSRSTTANWRRALGVGRATAGTQHLYQSGSIRANGKIISQSYHLWTPEEEALLGTAPDRQISDLLKRSVYSVYSHRRYKGIPVYRASSRSPTS